MNFIPPRFQKIALTAFATILLFSSCQKEFKNPEPPPDQAIFPTNDKDKQNVLNIKEVSQILKEVYKNPKAYYEACATIYSGYYQDESILLKDLLFPETSPIYKMKKFQTFKATPGTFKKEFLKVFHNGRYPNLSKAFGIETSTLSRTTAAAPADTTMEIFSNSNGVMIYFPYSENFAATFTPSYFDNINTDPWGDLATVIPADREADSAPGDEPFRRKTYDENGEILWYIDYQPVTVNDAYAETKATHIVGVGIEPSNIEPPSEAFQPGGPIDIPNLVREVKQVYIGDVRVNNGHQWDKLISLSGNGGGSEIRFTRSDGFLKLADGQVQADNFLVGRSHSISRKNIKKSRFVNYGVEWDGDWEPDNLEQYFAIYEEDNRNSSTITGSLSTTLALTLTPLTTTTSRTIGFTLNYKSDDYIIKQTSYKADVFFALNRTNLEGEIYNNWPVRERYGDVSFTFNDRTFY